MFEEAARYKDDFCVYVSNGHYCGLVNTVYPVDSHVHDCERACIKILDLTALACVN